MRVRESEYLEAQDSLSGWCETCGAFVGSDPVEASGMVEDDIYRDPAYPCELCGGPLSGAGEALLAGLITVVPDEQIDAAELVP